MSKSALAILDRMIEEKNTEGWNHEGIDALQEARDEIAKAKAEERERIVKELWNIMPSRTDIESEEYIAYCKGIREAIECLSNNP